MAGSPVGTFARGLGANALRLLRRPRARALWAEGGSPWLVLRLGPQTDDEAPSLGPALPWAGRRGPSPLGLLEALRLLDAAAEDERVAGVVLRFHGPLPGWSKALALRRAVERCRAAGRGVVAWAEGLAADGYLVASAAQRVWLAPAASLFLVGLRTDHVFLRGLLSHLDVKPEVVRVGSFKTAAETLTRDGMSPEQREQLEAWLDDLYEAWVGAVADGRGLEPDAVRDRVDQGPWPARRAAEAGLADGCLYPDELPDALEALTPVPADGGPRRPRLVEGRAYLALEVEDAGWRPLLRELPRLAYVVVRGPVRRGSGPMGAGSDALRRLFAGLCERPDVRGVVLRVDSPGGDAVASDMLYRGLRLLAREKPVVVSMGDVAASGGYYLAAAADAVLAEVSTITGSIGVVGGKLNLEGLYRRLGIGRESLERGARAGLLSETRPFAPDERSAVRREMEAVYDTFVERVAEGRGLAPASVRRLGGGRIWSGRAAREHGLVDGLGGPLEALEAARRRCGLLEGEPWLLEELPRRPRLLDWSGLSGTVTRRPRGAD